MLDQQFIRELLQTYPIEPQTVQSIQTQAFDWRDLLVVTDATGRMYLLRLLHMPNTYDATLQTAQLLLWLQQQHYTVPQIFATSKGQLVGQYRDWTTVLLAYIPGEPVQRSPVALSLLAAALGRLHALPLPPTVTFPQSRCHPAVIAATTQDRLRHANKHIAGTLQPFVQALYATSSILMELTDTVCVTHGDCWYANAICTTPDAAVLIDWDCAGLGSPLLDLGYLLLTSHFDLTQPLRVEPDQACIQAILDGYRSCYPLARVSHRQLLAAVRFLLVDQVATYFAANSTGKIDDPLLQKLFARFAATSAIADIAYQYLVTQP